MRYSKKVAVIGFLVGLLGIVLSGASDAGHGDTLLLSGFVVMAASTVCRSIEDMKGRSND